MLKRIPRPAERTGVHGATILVLYCLGCAALALWALARFPELGPRRPSAVILSVLAVMVALAIAGPVFEAVTGLGQYGVGLGLIAVVLPFLTAAFWVSGCVLRVLAELPGLRS
jgi:hypothetical protein